MKENHVYVTSFWQIVAYQTFACLQNVKVHWLMTVPVFSLFGYKFATA